MQEYKILKIENIYNIDDINKALPLLNSSGIDTLTDKTNIILNFDTVDIKLLENIKYNPLIQKTIEELYKIRSFSSSNGKIVFKSFNKDKRVKNKKENSKKRLAYEYYKKEFSKTNNKLNKNFINKIHCADSLDIIKKFPDNCIDIVLTSPPYNFGINYENTNDVNIWEDYFNKLFNIFKECMRVLKDSGRIIINYGNFDTHAQQIDAKNKEMRETLNEIQKKINGLAGDYESNSAVTIREKITGMTPRFESYQQVVDSYVKFIRNAAAQAKNLSSTLNANANQFK